MRAVIVAILLLCATVAQGSDVRVKGGGGSGGSTPGGSDTEFQYNDGGTLNGTPGMVYNDATDTTVIAPDGTNGVHILSTGVLVQTGTGHVRADQSNQTSCTHGMVVDGSGNITGCAPTSAGFDEIDTGTNTTATMTCGAGCTVEPDSTGSIVATEVDGSNLVAGSRFFELPWESTGQVMGGASADSWQLYGRDNTPGALFHVFFGEGEARILSTEDGQGVYFDEDDSVGFPDTGQVTLKFTTDSKMELKWNDSSETQKVCMDTDVATDCVAADHIDALTEIAAALKTGTDGDKIVLADSAAYANSSGVCTDANGDLTTTGCVGSGPTNLILEADEASWGAAAPITNMTTGTLALSTRFTYSGTVYATGIGNGEDWKFRIDCSSCTFTDDRYFVQATEQDASTQCNLVGEETAYQACTWGSGTKNWIIQFSGYFQTPGSGTPTVAVDFGRNGGTGTFTIKEGSFWTINAGS